MLCFVSSWAISSSWMTERHSRGDPPTQRIRTPHLVELVPPAPDDVLVEAHEEADLVRRAAPVLRREGVGGQG